MVWVVPEPLTPATGSRMALDANVDDQRPATEQAPSSISPQELLPLLALASWRIGFASQPLRWGRNIDANIGAISNSSISSTTPASSSLGTQCPCWQSVMAVEVR